MSRDRHMVPQPLDVYPRAPPKKKQNTASVYQFLDHRCSSDTLATNEKLDLVSIATLWPDDHEVDSTQWLVNGILEGSKLAPYAKNIKKPLGYSTSCFALLLQRSWKMIAFVWSQGNGWIIPELPIAIPFTPTSPETTSLPECLPFTGVLNKLSLIVFNLHQIAFRHWHSTLFPPKRWKKHDDWSPRGKPRSRARWPSAAQANGQSSLVAATRHHGFLWLRVLIYTQCSTFHRQILSLPYGFFSPPTFRPRLVRALLLCINPYIIIVIICYNYCQKPWWTPDTMAKVRNVYTALNCQPLYPLRSWGVPPKNNTQRIWRVSRHRVAWPHWASPDLQDPDG